MKKNKSLIISFLPLVPFIICTFKILYLRFFCYTSASNSGAFGLGVFLIFGICDIPLLILSILSLKKANNKLIKIISIIDVILWSLVTLGIIMILFYK